MGGQKRELIAMFGFKDGRSLEPYFRRSRELVRKFAHESNPLSKVENLNRKVKEFEKVIIERDIRG